MPRDFSSLLASEQPTAERPLVILTGAGMSAASGIPTFRGKEGYWTVGSREYRPEELATNAAYQQFPREVWRWYLYRKAVCNGAEPNAGHRLLQALEADLGDAFALVTQNVDGLHTRAGNTFERTFEVHGNIDRMRDEVTRERLPIPASATVPTRDAPLDDATWAALVHPTTGNRCRPHILWFDEVYEEDLYRAETAMRRASRASILVIVGTSGAASLPWHAAQSALAAGAVLVDINPEDNPFRDMASSSARGVVLDTDAVDGLTRLRAALRGP